MKSKYKSREEVLRNKLGGVVDNNKIDKLVEIIKDYESANLITIEKLTRIKKLDLNKISGALKQCINAHGDINEKYIPSAAKRIYGSIMLEDNCLGGNQKTNPFSIRGILLGMAIYGIIHLIIHVL